MGSTDVTPEPPNTDAGLGRPLSWRREAARVLAALLVYFGGRIIFEGSTARSTANARRLLELEAAIGIDVEAAIQDLAVDNVLLRTIGNLSYVWLHWPLLIAALVLLFLRDPAHYRQLRDALFASGAVGLVLFAVLPMAPPRFMPGFVGTVSDDARRHYLDYPIEWANRYAAFPSFHVGWTLVACLAVVASLGPHRWRAIALVPALLVGVSVITTGNHYLLDALAGAAIALAAYHGAGSWHRLRTERADGPAADANRAHPRPGSLSLEGVS
jgi:membrane-associated phospholipid phosphatase